MECFFINLRQQTGRREFLERNFADHKRPGWFLNRVEAIDQEQAAAAPAAAGAISETERACFLSHRQALLDALEAPGHVLILEDDAMFGPNSCVAIEKALGMLGDDGWDLAYADLGIFHAPLMAELIHFRRRVESTGDLVLLEPKAMTFAGATAYIVNQHAKQTLLELIHASTLHIQYDLFLRELIALGKLRARIIFPFPLSLSTLADYTQIQQSGMQAADWVFNTFRRFIWADRDLGKACASLDALPPDFIDEEAAAIGRIMSAAFSRRLVRN